MINTANLFHAIFYILIGQNDNTFANNFDVEEVTKPDEIDVNNPNDEKLVAMERKMLTGEEE